MSRKLPFLGTSERATAAIAAPVPQSCQAAIGPIADNETVLVRRPDRREPPEPFERPFRPVRRMPRIVETPSLPGGGLTRSADMSSHKNAAAAMATAAF